MAYDADMGGGWRGWINQGAARWVAIAVGVVLIVGAGVLAVHYATRPGNAVARGIMKAGYTAKYVCKGCGASGDMANVPFDGVWPLECPECKAIQAVRAFRCRRCKKLTENTGGRMVRCQHCGYQHRIPLAGGGARPPMLK